MSSKPRRPFASRAPRAAPGNPRKEPRQSRAKATVEAIHEAALQVLQEVGHDRLTTTRVALRAGVSVGTLYQYYGDKDALLRALVVAYLGRAERAMRAVLEEDATLRTLARHLVRRFVAFKLEGGVRGEALRGVFLTTNGQAVANEAVTLVVAKLCQRIHASEPTWPVARVVHVANMWATIVFGTTAAMMDRAPELVAEPWFGESLERALLALLKDPAK